MIVSKADKEKKKFMEKTKTVMVTGASSGIGFAIAEACLKRGYNVVANSRSLENLQKAADKLGNPDNFLLVAGDISKRETSVKLFAAAAKAFGKVDILVNNAGIFISKPLVDYTEEDVDTIIDTNLKGFFYPSQMAAEHMRKNRSGHIVAITAALGIQPNAKVPALLPVLVKGGLNQAIRDLALELAPHNIMVNGIAPGIIETPMHSADENVVSFMKQLAPLNRIGKPQDIVNAVFYLTDSNFVTGTVAVVDGGTTAGIW